jgi:hypothetical protein
VNKNRIGAISSFESSLGIKIGLARRNGSFMSQKRLYPILYTLFVLQTTHSSKMKVIVLLLTALMETTARTVAVDSIAGLITRLVPKGQSDR